MEVLKAIKNVYAATLSRDRRITRPIAVSVVAILLCTVPFQAFSQTKKDSATVQVLFPVSKTSIDPAYKGNGSRLQQFIAQLKAAQADPTKQLSKIHVSGYTSPDGSADFNKNLARERASSMASYLRTEADIHDSLINIRYTGIDWQGLSNSVGASNLQNKAQVLDLILNEPEFTYANDGRLLRSRKQMLMNLSGGRTWGWMKENLFPQLRSSASVVYYIESVPEQKTLENTTEETADEEKPLSIPATPIIPITEEITEPAGSVGESQPVQPAADTRYPILALRTNALVPLLNAGVELPLGNRLSLGADYYYPWQPRNDNHKNCFQLIFFSGEARYWLGKNRTKEHRLLGHSIGVYGAWGYYDLEHNWSGHQGDFTSFGADYLYAKPIFKGKLHLEFQLAVGYIHSKAQPYDVFNIGGRLIREKGVHKNYSFVGPTKVAVNLVLPLNVKKGGRR